MSPDSRPSVNPGGTVGVAVIDGPGELTAQSTVIRTAVEQYLQQSGIDARSMPFKGMGNAGEFLIALGSGIAIEAIVQSAARVWSLAKAAKERIQNRQLVGHRRRCSIQIGDRRAADRDVIELLLLLPELHSRLGREFPNRNYNYIIFSASSTVPRVTINLMDFTALARHVNQMAHVINRNPSAQFLNLYLVDAPFGTRRVAVQQWPE